MNRTVMSETDSENDYESADDEEKHSAFEDNVSSSEKIPDDVEAKQSVPETVTANDVSIPANVINSQNQDTKTADNTSSNSYNDTVKVSDESKVENSNLQSEASVQELVQEDHGKNREDSTSATDSPESQPVRVTLRLEKKMQKKMQSVPKGDSVEEQPKPEEQPSSSWNFSSWGSSLLSTAASSVSTFTSQVSQGIETVLETVESSLGAPPPEDLAAVLRERRDSEKNPVEENVDSTDVPSSGDNKNEGDVLSATSLFTGVSSLKSVIENTGTKVFMGGLDTLELIGKKTIDILTEGDPGLRKKRSVFSHDVNLSQLLREAKEKAEQEQANLPIDQQEDSVYFSTFFDEFQGLVHLEALEMLSTQCRNKVEGALLMSSENNRKEELDHIRRICQDLPSADDTPDDKSQDFEENLAVHLRELQLQVDLIKIKDVCKAIHNWLDKCIAEQDAGEVKDGKEVYHRAIKSLAEFTARCVEQFHKLGELLLIHTDPDFNTLICATHLTGLTSVLCVELSIIATKFCQCLNTVADDSEDPDSVTPMITTVFLEASNGSTYIQDAFQLFVPVLQTLLLQ